ncbi:MAG: flagellin, partial [Mesorhizobium sp.]
MASIMTNASALTALQSLNATQKNLDTTQARISTGYRVSQASDNAAYWSIATTMRSDNQAMSTVSDALGLGASKVDTAYTGMDSAIKTINQIQQKLTASYGQTDASKEKTQVEIKALQDQLKAYADGATFSGT